MGQDSGCDSTGCCFTISHKTAKCQPVLGPHLIAQLVKDLLPNSLRGCGQHSVPQELLD